MVLAFASLASLVGSNSMKTLPAALTGLMLAAVGIDVDTGVMRYNFGIPDLPAGIEFLVIVIGLFGMVELIHLVKQQASGTRRALKVDKCFVSMRDLVARRWTILRSSIIGFLSGILAGTGASVASAVAYGTEKRVSDRGGTFGHGDPKGLAAPKSANNAAAGVAWCRC
jgi:putative tricarboxylic transport membrane protein